MPRRILVIDDEEDIRAVLKGRLERHGYRVFEAACAEEALTLAEKKDFSVIIIDILMPGMDGIELYNALKEMKNFQNTKFIFLTALGEKERSQQIKSARGNYTVMGKPYDFEKLLKILSTTNDKKG